MKSANTSFEIMKELITFSNTNYEGIISSEMCITQHLHIQGNRNSRYLNFNIL